jgi:magnesium chelatase subunit D
LSLAIAHRASSKSNGNTRPTPSPSSRDEDQQTGKADGDGDRGGTTERVFAPADVPTAPRLLMDRTAAAAGSGSRCAEGPTRASRGPVIGARRAADPRELDVRSSLVHAATRDGNGIALRTDDLHEKRRAPQGDTRFIVIVDSSGSHAVQERMGLVKGAVAALLDASHSRHDEVVVIACRGAAASVLVEPTSSREDVERALEYLPTGGRTPLAHALDLAASYVTDRALLVLVTDGHANVPHRSDDAWDDALTTARAISCPALVIDSEDARRATGRPRDIAEAMGATYARLGELDQAAVLRIVREGA